MVCLAVELRLLMACRMTILKRRLSSLASEPSSRRLTTTSHYDISVIPGRFHFPGQLTLPEPSRGNSTGDQTFPLRRQLTYEVARCMKKAYTRSYAAASKAVLMAPLASLPA